MKNILIVIVLLVIVGAAVGFYRGWFSLSVQKDSGQSSATVSVDKDKMEADKDRVREMGR